jgi:hypothetical protein
VTEVIVDYTNYRGERRKRRVIPANMPLKFTSNEFHTEEQWFVTVFDCERGGVTRDFAMKDIHSWEPVRRMVKSPINPGRYAGDND